MTTVEIEPTEVIAAHGDKRISLSVNFWTNDLAEEEGHIVPKHAWDSGTVRMVSNPAHGIHRDRQRHFHSLAELPNVIEKTLIENGIKLVPADRTKKYMLARRDFREDS